MAQTWGYKDDTGNWQEADPFENQKADDNVDFPPETYRKAAGVAYEYSKKKLEDATAQQKQLAEQRQQYSQQDEARDVQQARQAYRY